MSKQSEKRECWNSIWEGASTGSPVATHPLEKLLKSVVSTYSLHESETLEVGCGLAHLQDLFKNYTGLDVSDSSRSFVKDPGRFVCGSAEQLPFEDGSFNFVFSIYCMEHVPHPERSIAEIWRVLGANGMAYLKPAWFCRPWNGKRWYHQSWKAASLTDKAKIALTKVRNSIPYRFADLLRWRSLGVGRGLIQRIVGTEMPLRYRRIEANYSMPEVIDADAEAWLDPYDFVAWWESKGGRCLSHDSLVKKWTDTRSGVLLVKTER